jgi:hypothetical protein
MIVILNLKSRVNTRLLRDQDYAIELLQNKHFQINYLFNV